MSVGTERDAPTANLVALNAVAGQCDGVSNDLLLGLCREHGWPYHRVGTFYFVEATVAAAIVERYRRVHRDRMIQDGRFRGPYRKTERAEPKPKRPRGRPRKEAVTA